MTVRELSEPRCIYSCCWTDHRFGCPRRAFEDSPEWKPIYDAMNEEWRQTKTETIYEAHSKELWAAYEQTKRLMGYNREPTMTDKPKTREIALDLIAKTHCDGPSGDVGGSLAEDIMKNLEAGGFSFPTAKPSKEPEPDHDYVRKAHGRG